MVWMTSAGRQTPSARHAGQRHRHTHEEDAIDLQPRFPSRNVAVIPHRGQLQHLVQIEVHSPHSIQLSIEEDRLHACIDRPAARLSLNRRAVALPILFHCSNERFPWSAMAHNGQTVGKICVGSQPRIAYITVAHT